MHGWPACRLEAGLIPDLPVRLLALDRPGYGGSTVQKRRRLLDWPGDVAAVADQLGLGRFHMVGLSGGGPFAAACAMAMPERVRGLALIAPVPPAYPPPRRAIGAELLYRFGRRPRTAWLLLTVARLAVRLGLVVPRDLLGRMPAPDRAVMTDAVLEALSGIWREGLGRGIGGALADLRSYATDWGFQPSSIRVPTSLWFGTDDSLIGLAGLAPYRAIPGINWHVLPGEGHFSLPLRHSRAIVRDLLR